MNNSKRLFVRPADKKVVRYPYPPFQQLKREGQHVPNISYWRRRIKDKDVFLITEEARPNTEVKNNRKRKIEPDKKKQ